MMRLPIGSVPPFGSTKRIRPWPTNVRGTVAASRTVVNWRGLIDAKYCATSRIS